MASEPQKPNKPVDRNAGSGTVDHGTTGTVGPEDSSEPRKKLASAFAKLTRTDRSTGHPDAPLGTRFETFDTYRDIQLKRGIGEKLKLENPFFRSSTPITGTHIDIDGRECVDFASYNYLGLNRHPSILAAATAAIEKYGTSALASRVVGGNRPIHRNLEGALANFFEVDDCAVFVSGYATNVTLLPTLFGAKDLILYDELIHKSIIDGATYSGSARRRFKHNSWQDAERILRAERRKFRRILVVIEGVYSMDGDIPNLPEFVRLRSTYDTFLMVDEAHSLGILGDTGRGIRELYDIPGGQIDIWMGTLSKTLASTGGFIAGSHALIEILRASAPGFVYSVGLPPPMAAAALAALELVIAEPERTARVKENGKFFLETAKKLGLNTGRSTGNGVIALMIGGSLNTIAVSVDLLGRGFNVMPLIYPAVEEKQARLRFFVTSDHCHEDIEAVLQAVDQSIRSVRKNPILATANAIT